MLKPKHTKEDIEYGIDLLRAKKYDEAIGFFKEKLHLDKPLAYYGLAASMFRKKRTELSLEEAREAISYYQKAIDKAPEWGEPYYGNGLVLQVLAIALTKEFKKNPYENMDEKVQEIKDTWNKSKSFIEKAGEISKCLEWLVEPTLANHKKHIKIIDELKEDYLIIKENFSSN